MIQEIDFNSLSATCIPHKVFVKNLKGFININRTHLCLMDTPFFFLQESSFLYSPSEAQIKDKEVNHDILWREGKTFKV